MSELKSLSAEAIPEALKKAKHYRLLNSPWQAESICRDILRTDPDNQQVIYVLILSITDQFESYTRTSPAYALELASKLTDTYDFEYCRGLIYERWAIATYKRQTPGSGHVAYEQFQQAMQHFENAENVQKDSANKEAILRWNACVRFIQQYDLKPQTEAGVEPYFED